MVHEVTLVPTGYRMVALIRKPGTATGREHNHFRHVGGLTLHRVQRENRFGK